MYTNKGIFLEYLYKQSFYINIHYQKCGISKIIYFFKRHTFTQQVLIKLNILRGKT